MTQRPNNPGVRPASPVRPEPAAAPRCQDAAARPAAPQVRDTTEVPVKAETGTDTDLVFHLYLREIGQIKLLTRPEELDLARRVRRGDEAAREQMIKANLRLVVKIAREYEGLGLALLDLISEGNIGLMKAVERYDPERGVKFSSYSSFWIKQAIRRGLANHSKTIRLPVHVQEKLMSISRVSLKLREALGRDPEEEELAAEVGISARRIRRFRRAALSPVSLDAPLEDDETHSLSESVADENAQPPDLHIDDQVNLKLLIEALRELHPRETIILRERFGLNGKPQQTLDQVSRQFGLTRERIRQIQHRALQKLRAKLEGTPTVQVAA
jgi:RNA polymerase primary sigma factor